MPRNYEQKTAKSYTSEMLEKSINTVKTGKMSLHKSSMNFIYGKSRHCEL